MRFLLIFVFLLMISLSIDLDPFDARKIRTSQINVTIEGEVEYPGTYTLNPYSELEDLLDLAVLKDTAETDTLNPQMTLKDKDIIIIQAADRPHGKISINTGTMEELCTLPGIGETTAAKIIEYRNTNGFFQTLEELKNVKGIGEKKYAGIVEEICL